MKLIIPYLEATFTNISEIINYRRQYDRRIIVIYDLVLLYIRCDTILSIINETNLIQSMKSSFKLAINILTIVFRQYRKHRITILLEILTISSEVYSIRIPVLSYTLDHLNCSITTIYATLLTLMQSIISIPYQEPGNPIEDNMYFQDPALVEEILVDFDISDQIGVLKQSFNDCQKYCAYYMSELFNRCFNKEMTCEYRQVTIRLLEELQLTIYYLNWPVTSLLLEAYVCRIRNDVLALLKTEFIKKDISYITFLLDTLAGIFSLLL